MKRKVQRARCRWIVLRAPVKLVDAAICPEQIVKEMVEIEQETYKLSESRIAYKKSMNT